MFNQNSLIDITTAFVNDQIIQSAELDLDGLIHFRLNLDNEWLVFGPTVPIDNGVDDDGIIVENLMEQMSYGYKYNWFGRGVKQMHVFRFPEDAAVGGNNLLYHNEVWNSTWPSNFSADIEITQDLLNNTPNFSLASNTNYVINDDLLHEIIGDDHEFTVTYYVKVEEEGGSNKFVIYKDSAYTEEYLDLGSHIKTKNNTKYIFDQSDSSNAGHRLLISNDASVLEPYNCKIEGVLGNDAQTTFSPTLPESNFNIYCENHGSAMGSKYTISIDKIVETYWVKVEDQAGANKFVFYTDSNYQYQVSSGTTITLKETKKYQFDQSDSSNDGHKLEIRIPKIIDNVLQPVGNDRNLDEVLNTEYSYTGVAGVDGMVVFDPKYESRVYEGSSPDDGSVQVFTRHFICESHGQGMGSNYSLKTDNHNDAAKRAIKLAAYSPHYTWKSGNDKGSIDLNNTSPARELQIHTFNIYPDSIINKVISYDSSDMIVMNNNNNEIILGGGHDTVDGQEGDDIVILPGEKDEWQKINYSSSTKTLRINHPVHGNKYIRNVEFFRFGTSMDRYMLSVTGDFLPVNIGTTTVVLSLTNGPLENNRTNELVHNMTVAFSRSVVANSVSTNSFDLVNCSLSNLTWVGSENKIVTFDVTAQNDGIVQVKLPAGVVYQQATPESELVFNLPSNILSWSLDTEKPTVEILSNDFVSLIPDDDNDDPTNPYRNGDIGDLDIDDIGDDVDLSQYAAYGNNKFYLILQSY